MNIRNEKRQRWQSERDCVRHEVPHVFAGSKHFVFLLRGTRSLLVTTHCECDARSRCVGQCVQFMKVIGTIHRGHSLHQLASNLSRALIMLCCEDDGQLRKVSRTCCELNESVSKCFEMQTSVETMKMLVGVERNLKCNPDESCGIG